MRTHREKKHSHLPSSVKDNIWQLVISLSFLHSHQIFLFLKRISQTLSLEVVYATGQFLLPPLRIRFQVKSWTRLTWCFFDRWAESVRGNTFTQLHSTRLSWHISSVALHKVPLNSCNLTGRDRSLERWAMKSKEITSCGPRKCLACSHKARAKAGNLSNWTVF